MKAFSDIRTIPWLGIVYKIKIYTNHGVIYEDVTVNNTTHNYAMIDWEAGCLYLSFRSPCGKTEDITQDGLDRRADINKDSLISWLTEADLVDLSKLIR